MPLLGGIAVAAAFFAGMLAVEQMPRSAVDPERWWGLFAGGLVLIGTGVWDDRFGMTALPKLTLQLIAAAIAIASGFEISRLSDPGSGAVVMPLPRWGCGRHHCSGSWASPMRSICSTGSTASQPLGAIIAATSP